MPKRRLDTLLAERGLFASRTGGALPSPAKWSTTPSS
jgi:hypothetical protein